MISPLRRKKGKKGWASKFKEQLKSSKIFHVWLTPCKTNQWDTNMREETIADDKAHFIPMKQNPKMKTLTILDLCDYVCIRIGLPVKMSCRPIVTNF